uniref:Thioredoxin domain-containing protein n=1 Tax=Schlesneria paludicola TaxID=360056 RepID=A0A7C2NVV6_9PLAN
MHGSAYAAPRFPVRGLLICLAGTITGAGLVSLSSQFHPVGASATSNGNLQDGVLLDFTATWCGPCQKMSPIVSRLEQQGYPIRKVDVDKERDLAERFGIKTIPTFVLVVGGREVMRQSGGDTSEAQLRRMLLQIPEWQRELARRDAKPAETKVAANVEEVATTPSPFAVDLGEPAPAEKPKPKFTLPLLGGLARSSSTPKSDVPRTGEFEARGQSPDADPKSQPATSNTAAVHARLRVKDQGGTNFGSGTVIDSRIGRTLILTCGHLFRDLKPGAMVEVDIFDSAMKPETLNGQIVDFDLAADVGLVAIPTRTALPAAKIASLNRALQAGERVSSIGCSGGDLPSREALQITALNKYDGPDNVECTGVPIRGRSGGGLFRGEELIGVCIAADPREQRGLYCGLKPIYELIERAGFAQLLPVGRPEVVPTSPPTAVAAAKEAEATPLAAVPAAVPPSPQPVAPGFEPISTEPASTTAVPSADALADALHQSPDAEIICIVRPKNSSAPSRVVIVNQPSPKLLSYLLDGANPIASAPAPAPTTERKAEALIPTSGSTSASANREFTPRTSSVATSINDAPRRPQSPRPR